MKCSTCGEDHDPQDCPLGAANRNTVTLGPSAVRPGAGVRPSGLLAGRYQIVARIGSGGMGEVYRAHDIKLDQSVALKFLPGDLSHDERRLALLLNEVRVARQVSHPNVCRVHDVVESEGRHFLTMELIEGATLGELLARKGRPAPEPVR